MCFGHFLCPSSGVFHCKHSKGICHRGLLTVCEQDKFEKLVHLVGFIIRIYHDARSPEHLSRCTVTWTFITMQGHLNIYHDARSPEHLSRCTVTWTFITMQGHLNIYHDTRSPEHLSRCKVTWTFITMQGHLNVKFKTESSFCYLDYKRQETAVWEVWRPHKVCFEAWTLLGYYAVSTDNYLLVGTAQQPRILQCLDCILH